MLSLKTLRVLSLVEITGSNSCLDLERSLAVDAMALLGGNEYLVQQMIDRLSETNYRFAAD